MRDYIFRLYFDVDKKSLTRYFITLVIVPVIWRKMHEIERKSRFTLLVENDELKIMYHCLSGLAYRTTSNPLIF